MWQQKSAFLRKNNEFLDMKLWTISEALGTAMQEILGANNIFITVLSNLQKTITTI